MKVSLGTCKSNDFVSTLGPWIDTADEFEDRHDGEGFLPISMSVEVNGEAFGQDPLSNMGWPFAELVACASQDPAVRPERRPGLRYLRQRLPRRTLGTATVQKLRRPWQPATW